jgi:NAD(P)-dependent dehydrogenase (short-subunit alcohol dehydrogenase family)
MTFAKYPSLAGRVVFVTGGASGIGADIVRAFAGQGAKVAFVDILDDAGEALVAELQGAEHAPVYFHCDLVDIEALKAVVAEIAARVGPVAVLVNNAANDERHSIDEVTPEYWDRSQGINLKPQFFAAQAVRPHMQELGYGSIINFSSIAWRGGADGMVSYATAKAGVQGLSRALARGFGGDNIRVNAIEPGAVITDKQRRLWYPDPRQVEGMVARQAIKRVLLGDEIARAVLFLAADDSRMITKQTIRVDAGLR